MATKPDIMQRSEWNARQGRALTFIPDDEWKGIEVHHSASVTSPGSDPAGRVRAIQNFHLDTKGWRDIFYGYLIHPNGQIIFGRGRNLSTSANNTHLTVCFLGNFEAQQPTQEAIDSFRRLRAWFLTIAPQATSLTYHGQRAATACCGKNLIAKMPSLALPPVPQDDVVAPTPPPSTGGMSVEEFEDKLHDARVDARKIAASLERQHEATLGAIEVLANRVVPLLNSLAGVQSRQRARAEEQLEQIDELLAELEKAGGR